MDGAKVRYQQGRNVGLVNVEKTLVGQSASCVSLPEMMAVCNKGLKWCCQKLGIWVATVTTHCCINSYSSNGFSIWWCKKFKHFWLRGQTVFFVGWCLVNLRCLPIRWQLPDSDMDQPCIVSSPCIASRCAVAVLSSSCSPLVTHKWPCVHSVPWSCFAGGSSWQISEVFETAYSFSHNHESGKWLYLKGNYYWRDPFFDFHDYGRKCIPYWCLVFFLLEAVSSSLLQPWTLQNHTTTQKDPKSSERQPRPQEL